MSSKIEVSRETLENILKDGASDPAVYTSYRQASADIRALLAAPVVERQPLTDNTFIRGWKVGTKYFGLRMEAVEWIRTGQAAAHGEDTKLMPLYFENHSPELAELQATIAQLMAENENWKQGSRVEADAGDEARAEVATLKDEIERLKKERI